MFIFGASLLQGVERFAAPKAPWLNEGAGIADPDVWAVKRCQQLVGGLLQRAPSGLYPPIWQDFSLLLVRVQG